MSCKKIIICCNIFYSYNFLGMHNVHMELDLDFELDPKIFESEKNVLEPKLKGLGIERIGLNLPLKNLQIDFALSN